MGILSIALALGMTAPAAADAPAPMKDRTISIPYNLSVNPADVSEVILYVSIDMGRTWSRASVIKPTDRFFPYQAPTDGQYWFNVAVVYKNNTQVPADVSTSPVQQKVLFDTHKPVVRIVSADRVGDEVIVNWDIQETNPDLASLKLEYRPTDASAGGFGYAVPCTANLTGQARFRPNTPAPITLKLALMDVAGNLGWAELRVGVVTPMSGTAPAPAPAPAAVPVPPPPVEFPDMRQPAPAAPLTPPGVVAVPPAGVPAGPTADHAAPIALATSQRNDVNSARNPVTPIPTPHTAMRQELPTVYHTNEPQVTIDYEIEKKGPSGISKVEVFITQDDGRTWQKWQDLTPNDGGRGDLASSNNLPVTVRLPDREGVFGFRMVPYSGSQLSVGAPQTGDAPEIRIQLDRTAPVVALYKPDADANDPNALVLQWKATDDHLTSQPIRIMWTDQPNGEWKSVTAGGLGGDAGLPNTGRHVWPLPTGLPLKIYLKIVAADQAGNVGEATTPQPIVVDLHKPVGRVRGIVSKPRN